MSENNIFITLYPFLVLIPFFVLMLKMKKKLAVGLFLLITCATSVVLYMTTDNITLNKVTAFVLSVIGACFLMFSGIKFKDSDTKGEIETNIILLALGAGFYIVSSPLVVAPLFVITFISLTLSKFYPSLSRNSTFLKLKQAFFTSKYSIENNVSVDDSIKPEVYPE